jgi:O-antigen ligase
MTDIWQKWRQLFFVYFQNSIFGRACLAVDKVLRRLFEKSWFVSLLNGRNLPAAVRNSMAFFGIGRLFRSFYIFSQRKGQQYAQKSPIVSAAVQLTEFLAYLWELVIYFGPNSFLFFLFRKNKEEANGRTRPKKVPLPKTALGLLLGLLLVLWAVLGVLKGTAVFGGVLFLFFFIWRPQLGIYSAVALAPFIPTMALAGLLLLTGGCFFLQLLFGREYHFKLDQTGFALLLFSALLLFYGATSYTPVKSLQIALLEVLFIGSYFLITSLMQKKEAVRRMIFIYCTSGLFTGFVGLYQFLSGKVDVTWTDTALFEEIGLRVYSTFENPNVYGEYLLLVLPIAMVMTALAKGLWGKVYYGAVSVVLLVNLGLTYSRGCYLALLFSAFLFVVFVAKPLLLLAIPALGALPFVLPSSIIARFASITNFTDTSTSYRLNIWQGTVRMLTDFWYLGIGLGQEAFNRVYPKYALNSIVAPHSHNLYLQVFLEMGIGGLISLFFVLACFANTCIRGIKKAKWGERLLIVAMLAGVGGFLLQGAFDYVWYNYRVFLLFFMTIGIGCAACATVERGESLF